MNCPYVHESFLHKAARQLMEGLAHSSPGCILHHLGDVIITMVVYVSGQVPLSIQMCGYVPTLLQQVRPK